MANFSSNGSSETFPPSSPEHYIQQLIEEAKTRWLKPFEICEILKSHGKLTLSEAAPVRPASGLLFLFDRNKLRHFRRDGHDWRKKNDGKTVREAHEKLKVENKDAIHCYYAHGGEHNPNFQRRCYWLLERNHEHIVLVHYREVTEKNVNPVQGQRQQMQMINHIRRHPNHISSPSVDASQGFTSNDEVSFTSTDEDTFDLGEIGCRHQFPIADGQEYLNTSLLANVDDLKSPADHITGANNPEAFENKYHNNTIKYVQDVDLVSNWHRNCFRKQPIAMSDLNQVAVNGNAYDANIKVSNEAHVTHHSLFEPEQTQNCVNEELQFIVTAEGNTRCTSKNMLFESETYWENVNGGLGISNLSGQIQMASDPSSLPSMQLFYNILAFAPEWSYAFEETKVIVTGIFLDHVDITNAKLCCMFGDIEVPVEILGSGALCCKAPAHKPGEVSFYITRGDRVACSEILKFHYREKIMKEERQELELLYQIRLFKLLFTGEDEAYSEKSADGSPEMKENMLDINEISWDKIEDVVKNNMEDGKSMFLQMLLKYELQRWLYKGELKHVDKHGPGVLHLVAALGYDWAITSILKTGIGVNFRDANGWTALHWAAFCGREKAIAALLAAGASPGAHTDPTPSDVTGRTAADLAAMSGHDGIASYLAESSLTNHLTCLNLCGNDILGVTNQDEAVNAFSEKNNMQASSTMDTDDLSMSLAAIRNATEAATRIQAAFRAYSFRKSNTKDLYSHELGLSEEEARAIAYTQSSQSTSHYESHNLAATQIQCKYRGWKGQKEFSALKKRVVKIQAHVRGYQARKKYKQFLWVVSVMEKVVLRWRRKGQGLRGFRVEEVSADSDDDTILKDFRRRKEEAFIDALNRVKLMVYDPKARDQYRRMLEVYQRYLQEKGDQFIIDDIIFDDDLLNLLKVGVDDMNG